LGRQNSRPVLHPGAVALEVILSIALRSLLIGCLVSGAVLAQTSGGMFRGEVRDTSNAVVDRATILIQSTDNGTEVPVASNG
jgi:hypothetical protein